MLCPTLFDHFQWSQFIHFDRPFERDLVLTYNVIFVCFISAAVFRDRQNLTKSRSLTTVFSTEVSHYFQLARIQSHHHSATHTRSPHRSTSQKPCLHHLPVPTLSLPHSTAHTHSVLTRCPAAQMSSHHLYNKSQGFLAFYTKISRHPQPTRMVVTHRNQANLFSLSPTWNRNHLRHPWILLKEPLCTHPLQSTKHSTLSDQQTRFL